MANDEGMTKSKHVRDVSHEALLESLSPARPSINGRAQKEMTRRRVSTLKAFEMIPISHSIFVISSSLLIGHSSFL